MISYGFYKIVCFRSRVEDSFYKEVLGRFLSFTVLPSVNKKVPGSFLLALRPFAIVAM
jgi:hypothetical protein